MVARRGKGGCSAGGYWLIAVAVTTTAATAISVLSMSGDSQADGKYGNSCQTNFDRCSFHRVFL